MGENNFQIAPGLSPELLEIVAPYRSVISPSYVRIRSVVYLGMLQYLSTYHSIPILSKARDVIIMELGI
jgi:hypothetical protein